MANINYKAFEAELEKLLNTVPHLVTEDTVRYQFIKVHNKDVQIEVPYIRNKPPHTPIKVRAACLAYFKNSLSRADLYYEANKTGITEDGKDAVMEFKFHRSTKYSNNCTTSKIGSVFADLNRLSTLDNDEKYLIYVFDRSMYDYFIKERLPDSPRAYFNLKEIRVGDVYDILPSSANTTEFFGADFSRNALRGFDKNIVPNMSAFNYKIEVKYAGQISNIDYYIVIYQVY